MRRARLVRMFAIAATLVMISAADVQAYAYNTYRGVHATEQPQDYTCVAASALTHLDDIWNRTDVSNATVLSYYNIGRPHIRYAYSGKGLDPRAWAWILYDRSPVNWTFQEYGGSKSGKYTQAKANTEMVYGIRHTGQPVGALVDRGRHAFDVMGFSSSFDPDDGPYTLNGFYIVDPWTPGKQWTGFDGGVYGLAPNTYLTLANWNAHYFRPYSDSQFTTIWDSYYIVVMRMNSTTAKPADTPGAGPWSDVNGATQAPMSPASEPVSADLATAVQSGIHSNLLDRNDKLGMNLSGVQVGASVRVESLSPDHPSYSIVELQRGRHTVAVAIVDESSAGFQLAGIRMTQGQFELPAVADARAKLGAGVKNVRLAWAQSTESASAFYPFWIGDDGGAAPVTLTLAGSRGKGVHLLH